MLTDESLDRLGLGVDCLAIAWLSSAATVDGGVGILVSSSSCEF